MSLHAQPIARDVAAALLAGLALSGNAWAEQPLPRFAPCMDSDIARFERALTRKPASPRPDVFDIGSASGVDVCGTAGIMLCDLSDAPQPCQHRLASEQEAWRSAVLDSLPAPETVAGQAGEWSDALYPQLHALAHDRSAGPDCAGSDAVMTAWCEAREANRRLQPAVLAWQLARYMGAAQPATDAGWAMAPPPTRPKARKKH